MLPRMPRQQPQRTAAKRGTAPDLDPSQVAAQEKTIGHVATCKNPGRLSQQRSKLEIVRMQGTSASIRKFV